MWFRRVWLACVSSGLGAWAVVALSLVAGTSLYTDLVRLEAPSGEKYVPQLPPGQTDFSYPYISARAMLAGVNPYRHDPAEFDNPYFPPVEYRGVQYSQVYPPGSLITLVPLVWWKGTDWQAAAHIWFRLSLASLVAIAALTWASIRRMTGTPLSRSWIFLLLMGIALSVPAAFGLDRGQSDIVTALLVWGALACYVRGARGAAVFLLIWATSIKGYPMLLTIGLSLLALVRGQWKQLLLGAVAGLAVFAAPVWRYLPDALAGMRSRAAFKHPAWFDHSFLNLVRQFAPASQKRGSDVITIFAVLVAGGAWVLLRRSFTRGTPRAQELWLTMFATASMAAVIGYSSYSASYNLILLLPGTQMLAAAQRSMSETLALPRWATHVLGASLATCLFLLFVVRLGDDPPGYHGGIAGAAYGLGLLVLILASLVARGLATPTRAVEETVPVL